MTKSNKSLYIHIPFCQRKCNYCDFFSIVCDKNLMNLYVDELTEEIRLLALKYPETELKTVYLGGGTPSLLSLDNINKISDSIYKNFRCKIEEFTIEVNPCSSQNLPNYKDFGINRISVGIQSFDDNVLRKIGRAHDSQTAINTLETAALHYGNVSGDLILGIDENQNICKDAEIMTKYVKHISAYMLKIEEGTPLKKLISDNSVSIATEDEIINQYNTLFDFCKKANFERYEISNFALAGYESKHNSHYWDMSDYLGVGAGAHSFVNGIRYFNKPDINEYIKGFHSGNEKAIIERKYSLKDTLEEYIMLALRTTKGISLSDFKRRFQKEFLSEYKYGIKKTAQYTNINEGYFYIKAQYFLVQNFIISELI